MISIWVKLHKNVVRYVLEIYFSCFFQENKNSQQVTWPAYDVIFDFAMNSMVKLLQNQKCCNFDKNWYMKTKFYQKVHFKDCNSSEMNLKIFSKNFPNFPISRFSIKSDIFECFLLIFPIRTSIWVWKMPFYGNPN